MSRQAIGQYEIKYILGEGGIGRVYAALDQELDRMVAIKALKPEFGNDASFVDRFRAEAASLARLTHPNITTLYSLHREGRELFMVMELVNGHTLEDVLARTRRAGLRATQAIIAQTAAGLGYAHRMGVIHRDIKPSNLMLTESGLLKIMDFGIARVRGSQRMTRAGSIVGTLAYVAPEQIKGDEGDERTDLYSLACVVYEMLSGDPPFHAETEYDLIRAQVEARPAPLGERVTGLDPTIEAVVAQALAKCPDDRFPTVDAFSRALGAAAIQGDAPDIVREQVIAGFARSPAAPTRVITGVPEATPAGKRGSGGRSSAPGTPPRAASDAASRPGAKPGLTGSKRLPVALLAGVAALLVLGLAYIAVDLSAGSASDKPIDGPIDGPLASGGRPPEARIGVNEEAATNIANGGQQREGRTPAPLAAIQKVPASSTIMPPPDAGTAPPNSLSQAVPPAAAPQRPAVIRGAVSSYSQDGWPVIDGQMVRLVGIDPLPAAMSQSLANWIATQGPYLECKLASSGGYRCLTASGIDVARTALLNGATHATSDATPSYRDAEQQARNARRGLWQ